MGARKIKTYAIMECFWKHDLLNRQFISPVYLGTVSTNTRMEALATANERYGLAGKVERLEDIPEDELWIWRSRK